MPRPQKLKTGGGKPEVAKAREGGSHSNRGVGGKKGVGLNNCKKKRTLEAQCHRHVHYSQNTVAGKKSVGKKNCGV